ncbi:MAG: hypothetical protein ACPG32_13490 [Akkermansiaceae bacterium]
MQHDSHKLPRVLINASAQSSLAESAVWDDIRVGGEVVVELCADVLSKNSHDERETDSPFLPHSVEFELLDLTSKGTDRCLLRYRRVR